MVTTSTSYPVFLANSLHFASYHLLKSGFCSQWVQSTSFFCCAKLALERGEAGPLEAPSAYYMKSPPRQLRDSVALEACNAFIDGRQYDLPAEKARGAMVAERPRRSK